MTTRRLIGCLLLVVLCQTPLVLRAQASGLAFATWHDGNVFDGFVGPVRVTQTGVDFNLVILCFASGTREKRMAELSVSIPDGSTLLQFRTLMTTSVVDTCASMNIAVPRGAVVLPAMQLGI